MPEPPSRIVSTVPHTLRYEAASRFAQTSAATAATSRIAAPPVSVRRNERSGSSRLRAQAVRPENGAVVVAESVTVVADKAIFDCMAETVGTEMPQAPTTEMPQE